MIGHTVIGQLAGYARDRIKILREKPIDQINIPVEKRLYLSILALVFGLSWDLGYRLGFRCFCGCCLCLFYLFLFLLLFYVII